tara:strand:+ start:471 stop:584 length:114 start_codon:yes stop_codon:yes gene_type:complete
MSFKDFIIKGSMILQVRTTDNLFVNLEVWVEVKEIKD